MTIAEKHRHGILEWLRDIWLIRDYDEVSIAVAVNVVDCDLPWLGSCSER